VDPEASPDVLPPGPQTDPVARNDVAPWSSNTGDCRAFVLRNDKLPDAANTRVFLCCADGEYVEVDSVRLAADGQSGPTRGCEAEDGGWLDWGTDYDGDALASGAVFQTHYYVTYTPPGGYTAAFTGKFSYKLARDVGPESTAAVTCKVPKPTP
jgi:hypothetical protein